MGFVIDSSHSPVLRHRQTFSGPVLGNLKCHLVSLPAQHPPARLKLGISHTGWASLPSLTLAMKSLPMLSALVLAGRMIDAL